MAATGPWKLPPFPRRAVFEIEPAVRKAIKRPLKAHQFDALVCFAFNIGAGGFSGSTAAKRINAGDFSGAADAMLLWRRPPEIVPRRRRERELFLLGKYR